MIKQVTIKEFGPEGLCYTLADDDQPPGSICVMIVHGLTPLEKPAAKVFPAKPLAFSHIAKALGLEGRPLKHLSICLFNDDVAYVSATMLAEEGVEQEVAEVLKRYFLVEKDLA